jgi:rubrerythrin
MSDDQKDQNEKKSDVYWSFRCESCGFLVVKLCNDIDPCPICNKELVRTYFQYFN